MQISDFPYRRTPLPDSARLKLGWIFFLLALLISSPFIGFALQGSVGEAGLVLGLGTAILPLTGLIILSLCHWRAFHQLPPELAKEWRTGRLVAADGGPEIDAPIDFSQKENLIAMRADGVIISRGALLGLRGAPDAVAKTWISQTVGDCFVPWREIKEWEVCSDSDGPDYYRLPLQGIGHILVRRFSPKESKESNLLDAVRSVGRLPVRMLCDLEET